MGAREEIGKLGVICTCMTRLTWFQRKREETGPLSEWGDDYGWRYGSSWTSLGRARVVVLIGSFFKETSAPRQKTGSGFFSMADLIRVDIAAPVSRNITRPLTR